MFDRLSQFAGLVKNLPRIQEEMSRFQQTIGSLVAEGAAGADMVTFRVNGRMEILRCTISEEVLRLNDRELLEDLIRFAANQALDKARQLVHEETAKMASGLGLPPGMNLPGLG